MLTAALLCNSPLTYCPSGSSTPALTASGYYAIASRSGLFYNQSLCGVGMYCVGGVAFVCPAGRYGNDSGMTLAVCTGVCTAGFYCLPGSTTPTAQNCGSEAVYCPEVGVGFAVICVVMLG